ncbi:TetR/AcrR family transcriptional regulator [Marinitoga sp. 38H-ov]|uniref:TetR/AcrR family transcriptional regulator n=1 Tax=Marinitoga sp. 38H-ov TaxID=1755814 RepID=UPI0013EA8FE5|nr:TetR/AcrR family transcriptional regulator [Marinitoga sp. 38H-ov]KAF2955920.1 hypothetical protein AS160_08115 [Marinitoga sp. 38H-ov]
MEDTYEKIIKSAYEIFSKEGYQKASINKIKDRAKVSKGAIYHYFKSKEELYFKVLEYFLFEFTNIVDNVEISNLKDLESLGLVYIKRYKEDNEMQKFLIDFFLQSMLNKKINKLMNDFLKKAIEFIESKIVEMQRKGIILNEINANFLAQKIFLILDSLGIYISIGSDIIDLERIWIDYVNNNLGIYFKD